MRRLFTALSVCIALSACDKHPESAGEWEHSLSGLYAAAVSGDGRFAVVSSSADGASYWDLDENQRLYDWSHNDSGEDPISMIKFSPNDSHVITADSRSFVIWSTETGHALGYWSVDANINDVALANNARYVLLGLSDGRAIYIDQRSQRRLEVVAHQGEWVTQVDLSADGSIAVTGGNDRRVMVWRTSDGEQLHALQHNGRIGMVKIDPTQTRLFTADERDAARIWDLETGKVRATLELGMRQHVVSAARFSNNGSRLLLGFPGRSVSLWNVESGTKVHAWRTPNRKNGWVPQGSTVYAVAFDERAATVVAESSNGLGSAWRAKAHL